MYRFTNDYSEGAHPRILDAMVRTNLEGNFGYSTDPHSKHAHELIRAAIGRPDADVHILVGGTQTNATCLCAFLRPHEAAIAAASGHICVHETGAIEATGHKCIAMPAAPGGKLTPDAVRAAVAAHPDEHMVKPKLVYVSNTTETGGVYTTAELEALRAVCDELGLYLYLDGARLSSALAAGGASLTDLGRLCDAFYIGGTKNGALFGEAVCILNPALKPDFRYIIKQHGGMLAKGVDMSYIYLEEQQGYLIPVTSQMGLYTPKVEQLKKQDGKLRVTVGYVPTPALSGDYSMSTPSEPTKYMDYIFEKNGRTWYLTALETSEMKVTASSTSTSQPAEDAVAPDFDPTSAIAGNADSALLEGGDSQQADSSADSAATDENGETTEEG